MSSLHGSSFFSFARPAKATFLFLSVFLFSFRADAQQLRDQVKEHQYEAELLAIDSAAVPLFKKATLAMDQDNDVLADSLYSIVCAEAPTFEPALRRLGFLKSELGEKEEGIRLCEKAVSLNRSSDNLLILAQVLLTSGENDTAPSYQRLSRALDLLNEGQVMPEAAADDFAYTFLSVEATYEMKQDATFEALTQKLLTKYPGKAVSHYYGAIVAARHEEWQKARIEILLAKSMGLPEDTVNGFLDSGVEKEATIAFYKQLFLWVLLAWSCGFVLLYLLGLLLSNYTLRTIERESRSKEGPKGNTLRKIYRFLISFAGVYYYISLPVVLLLVAASVAGLFYLFLMLGRIPIQLMVIVGIGGIVTIYSMIRSLLLKVNYEDPGRALKEAEAPGLFALVHEVALTMGTRPIDEIRITPETDLAVYERGSWREKLQDKGKRILILGTGVLKDFKQTDFKAVIAHEYGHFSHRDTAGGAVALQVRRDMRKYLLALYLRGQTVWWNLAFQFLRLYDFIFRRISHGATRLQEVLADRVAAQTYGAPAFQNGLTYVIKRNIEFVRLAKTEIEDARKVKRPFSNLYELAGGSGTENAVGEELQKTLNRQTSRDDTHPSPADRFRYIEGLGAAKESVSGGFVRELFVDWPLLTIEMTTLIEKNWEKAN